jgi:stage II sporulation protein M
MKKYFSSFRFLNNVDESYRYATTLWPYIIVTVLLFSISLLMGWLIAIHSGTTEKFFDAFSKFTEPFATSNDFELLAFIAINNGVKLLLAVLFGVAFALWPVLFLFFNGLIIGAFANLVVDTQGWAVFWAGTLPHGIIEIPALILAVAVGMRVGVAVWQHIFTSEIREVKLEYQVALRFYLTTILPLVIAAAFVETYITPAILSSFLHG